MRSRIDPPEFCRRIERNQGECPAGEAVRTSTNCVGRRESAGSLHQLARDPGSHLRATVTHVPPEPLLLDYAIVGFIAFRPSRRRELALHLALVENEGATPPPGLRSGDPESPLSGDSAGLRVGENAINPKRRLPRECQCHETHGGNPAGRVALGSRSTML